MKTLFYRKESPSYCGILVDALLNCTHSTLLTDPRSVVFLFIKNRLERFLKMIKSKGGRSNMPLIVSILNNAQGDVILRWIGYAGPIVLL